ncbi:MAG TPA: hypothetical protein VF126_01135 [Acidobacteriaceae bacterium]
MLSLILQTAGIVIASLAGLSNNQRSGWLPLSDLARLNLPVAVLEGSVIASILGVVIDNRRLFAVLALILIVPILALIMAVPFAP